MGAFDGYIPTKFYGGSRFTKNNPGYQYISSQTAFDLYEGFGITELTNLLLEAENNNKASIYVWTSADKKQGQASLDTWYVRALIKHLSSLDNTE